MNRSLLVFTLCALAGIGAFVLYFQSGDASSPYNSDTEAVENEETDSIQRDQRLPAPNPKHTNHAPIRNAGAPNPESKPARPDSPTLRVNISGVVRDDQGGLADISVYLFPSATPRFDQPLATTKSGATGEFSCDNISAAAGRVFVAALGDGWSAATSKDIDVSAGHDVSGVELVIFAEAALNITVRNVENGAVISNATISLRANDHLNALLCSKLITDGNGSARLGHLPPGEHQVAASAKMFCADPDDPRTPPVVFATIRAGEMKQLDIFLKPGYAIFGKIMAKDGGKLIEDAEIKLVLGPSLNHELLATTFSDPDGIFRLDAVPTINDAHLCISAPGFAVQWRPCPTEIRGEEQDIGVIELAAGGVLQGVVLTAAGKPIAGAKVSLRHAREKSGFIVDDIFGADIASAMMVTTTDNDGTFIFNSVPSSDPLVSNETHFEIVARAEGFAPAMERAPTTAGQEAFVKIKLSGGGTLVGTVTDQASRPLAHVWIVAARDHRENSGSGKDGTNTADMLTRIDNQIDFARGKVVGIQLECQTDANGEYTITGLPEGKYAIVAFSPSHSRGILRDVQLKAGGTTRADIQLAVAGSVMGRFYNASGVTEANVVVAAYAFSNDRFTLRSAVTDSNGIYRIDGLPKGDYTVEGRVNPNEVGRRGAINSAQRVNVRASGVTNYDIHEALPNTSRIYGVVTMNGVPFKGEISLGGGGLSGMTLRSGVQCDEHGRYEMKNIPLGSYMVMPGATFRGAAKYLLNVRFRVSRTPEQEVDINFITLTIEGKVLMPFVDKLPADVEVYAAAHEPPDPEGFHSGWEDMSAALSEQATIDLDTGAFIIENLSPGQYFVYARSKDGGFVRVGPVIVDRPISGVTLELDGKTGSLAGMIENFVPRDDTEKAKKSHNSIGILMLEDQEGNRVNLGGTLGSPNDRSIVGVEPDGEYKAKFSRDNLPVGTWTVIFQVNNFAPIEKHNVVIEESKTTTLIFKLEPAGDLQVTVLNSDAALDLQAMSYTITASNGLPYRKRITWVDIMTNMLNPPDPTKQNVFLITDFPPDTYTMTLKLPDMKPVHTTFIIESDETTELDVTFEPK